MIANVGGMLDTLTEFGHNLFSSLPSLILLSFHEKTTNNLHTRIQHYSGVSPLRQPLAALLHNSWILVGLFLLSGDHGGFAQKNRVSPCFNLKGPVAPGRRGLTRYALRYHTVFTPTSEACECLAYFFSSDDAANRVSPLGRAHTPPYDLARPNTALADAPF